MKILRSDKSSTSVRNDDKARKSDEKWNRWYSKRFPYIDGQIKLAQKGKTKEDQSNRKNNRRPSNK
jgi:hypothetical protein